MEPTAAESSSVLVTNVPNAKRLKSAPPYSGCKQLVYLVLGEGHWHGWYSFASSCPHVWIICCRCTDHMMLLSMSRTGWQLWVFPLSAVAIYFLLVDLKLPIQVVRCTIWIPWCLPAWDPNCPRLVNTGWDP